MWACHIYALGLGSENTCWSYDRFWCAAKHGNWISGTPVVLFCNKSHLSFIWDSSCSSQVSFNFQTRWVKSLHWNVTGVSMWNGSYSLPALLMSFVQSASHIHKVSSWVLQVSSNSFTARSVSEAVPVLVLYHLLQLRCVAILLWEWHGSICHDVNGNCVWFQKLIVVWHGDLKTFHVQCFLNVCSVRLFCMIKWCYDVACNK